VKNEYCISVCTHFRIEILPERRGSRPDVQVTTKDTNARSLRFRFKTFELDWETPWVFAVSPGHLKLSANHLAVDVVFSPQNLVPCSCLWEIISERLFFLLLRVAFEIAFDSFTNLLATCRTTINFYISRNIHNALLCACLFLVLQRNNTWHIKW